MVGAMLNVGMAFHLILTGPCTKTASFNLICPVLGLCQTGMSKFLALQRVVRRTGAPLFANRPPRGPLRKSGPKSLTSSFF